MSDKDFPQLLREFVENEATVKPCAPRRFYIERYRKRYYGVVFAPDCIAVRSNGALYTYRSIDEARGSHGRNIVYLDSERAELCAGFI